MGQGRAARTWELHPTITGLPILEGVPIASGPLGETYESRECFAQTAWTCWLAVQAEGIGEGEKRKAHRPLLIAVDIALHYLT